MPDRRCLRSRASTALGAGPNGRRGFSSELALLQFDAADDREFLELGRSRTLERMAPHLTHVGVHDHGFNNVSTYGNLWRLMREGRFEPEPWEQHFHELALKVSGAVQAVAGPSPRVAGSSIRSMAPIRSLSTRFARFARWRCRTSWGTHCSKSRMRA